MDKQALLREVKLQYILAGKPGRVLLGLSGGGDSVALLLLLVELRKAHPFTLFCAHIHHGLRAASNEEEQFVQRLCQKQGIPVEVVRLDMKAGGNLESRARALRFDAFRRLMQSLSCDVLALGHHMDDQAETLVMRLMHGTGAQGLAGMRPVAGDVWRPLLGVRRSALQQYLSDTEQNACEDESNQQFNFLRNAVRHAVLPQMTALCHATVPNIARTAAILSDEEADWRERCEAWLEKHRSRPPAPYLMAAAASQLSTAMQRRVVRAFLEENGIQCDFAQLERLRALLPDSRRQIINLPGENRAMRTGTRLHLLTDSTGRIPLGSVIYSPSPTKGGRRAQQFDALAVEGAQLRYPQTGDRISPLGAGGSRKLGEYLIDRKVDLPLRRHWPVLASGNDVLWVPGVGMAQPGAVKPETAEVVWIRYAGRLPDEIATEE